MEEYSVTFHYGLTIVEHRQQSFKMSVNKDRQVFSGDIALLEATLYKEDGVFVKNGSYVFEALDKDNKPIRDVNVDDLREQLISFSRRYLVRTCLLLAFPKAPVF